MPSMSRGRLVTWKPDKGFGFIRPDGGGEDVFVHLRDFGTIARAPRPGDVIHYQRVSDGKGRFRAADVRVEGLERGAAHAKRQFRRGHSRTQRRKAGESSPRSGTPAWLLTLVFVVSFATLTALTALPVIIPVLYLVASLVTWLLYLFDKSAALNGRWRTSEGTLLMAGLLGGWPGGLIAQQQARHKTRKVSFLAAFWGTVAINCAALCWACTTEGARAIRALVY